MAQTVKIGGATYEDVPSITTTDGAGGSASFVDTSGATAAAGEILAGKKAFVKGAEVVGTMVDHGAVSGMISTKAGTYTVPAGHHNGAGKVQISATEQAKVIAGNIRSGVTLLGVAGSAAVVNTSDGTAAAGDILSGKTAYVNGSKVTGTYAPPTGYQVATGSFHSSSNPANMTVTGLGFRPVGCMFINQSQTGKSSSYNIGRASFSVYTTSAGSAVYGKVVSLSSSQVVLNWTGGAVEFTDDGFKVTGGTTYRFWGTFAYVAWG